MTKTEAQIIEAAKNWEYIMRLAPLSRATIIATEHRLIEAVEADRQARLATGNLTVRDI